jgi:hypothetical protein
MYLGAIDLALVVAVMREPSESRPVQIGRQRVVRGAQYIQTQIKLFASDQQRIRDVLLDDVRLGLRLRPGCDRIQFIKKEDPLALGLRSGLHYPNVLVSGLSELVCKHSVFEGQVESCGEEVVGFGFCLFALLFEELAVPLEIAAEVVLPA